MEYFQDAREALRPEGVFCQWFPLHQLTAYVFGLIQATFRTVFPKAHLFRDHLKTGNIILGMVGFRNAELNWGVVENRCESEREAGELRDPMCRHVEGMAMLYFGMLNGTPPGGPLNTLANMRVELDAGYNLVVMQPGILFSYAADGNPFFEFVRRRREACGRRIRRSRMNCGLCWKWDFW